MLRKFLSLLFIITLSLSFTMNEVYAKRFGGGRSFGVQRSQSNLFSKKSYNNAAMKRPNSSKWGSLLGGMLIGGLLASLFMGNGFANGIMTWLILGAVIFFIVQFFKKRMQPAWQSAPSQAYRANPISQFTQNFTNGGSSNEQSNYPVNFDSEQFLRNAKVTYIRLQTAYDQKNLQDLTSFTVPEVFAEIKMQLDERGDEPNTTEVIALNAELLDVSKQSLSTIASVRFTGSINENGEISSLNEIWHFRQFDGSNEWLVGGIQQDVY